MFDIYRFQFIVYPTYRFYFMIFKVGMYLKIVVFAYFKVRFQSRSIFIDLYLY